MFNLNLNLIVQCIINCNRPWRACNLSCCCTQYVSRKESESTKRKL